MSFQKEKPYRNKKILDYARGQECQIRLPGVCNENPETVVACHIRQYEFGAGIGIKPDDCCVAYCCSSCHDQLDGRTATKFKADWISGQFYKASIRTMRILFRDGVVK